MLVASVLIEPTNSDGRLSDDVVSALAPLSVVAVSTSYCFEVVASELTVTEILATLAKVAL